MESFVIDNSGNIPVQKFTFQNSKIGRKKILDPVEITEYSFVNNTGYMICNKSCTSNNKFWTPEFAWTAAANVTGNCLIHKNAGVLIKNGIMSACVIPVSAAENYYLPLAVYYPGMTETIETFIPMTPYADNFIIPNYCFR